MTAAHGDMALNWSYVDGMVEPRNPYRGRHFPWAIQGLSTLLLLPGTHLSHPTWARPFWFQNHRFLELMCMPLYGNISIQTSMGMRQPKNAGESQLPEVWNVPSITVCSGGWALLLFMAFHSTVAQWLSSFPAAPVSSCLPRAWLPSSSLLASPDPSLPMPQERDDGSVCRTKSTGPGSGSFEHFTSWNRS